MLSIYLILVFIFHTFDIHLSQSAFTQAIGTRIFDKEKKTDKSGKNKKSVRKSDFNVKQLNCV